MPYLTNNGLAGDHAYVNLVLAAPLAPEEALGAFNGEVANGTWTLRVSDDLAGDAGSLDSWSLEITTCPFVDALHAVSPARLMDTRAGATTVDSMAAGNGPIEGGKVVELGITGRGGVPANGAGAVALNVTVTEPTGDSFLTVYPAGAVRPTASNVNVAAGQTVPNMVIVALGANGAIALYNNNGSAHVIVDLLGWLPETTSFGALTPARLLETRGGLNTIDGLGNGAGAVGPAATVDVQVTGRGGVPATGVGSVALNVTATEATAGTFLTAHPAGVPRPTASNLNVAPGATVANMVLVPVGADGKVSIYNNAGSTHVVVDVLGWFPTAAPFTGLTPARLLDTREPGGNGLPQGPASTLDVLVAGRGGVPATGVGAVALNVTVTGPTVASFVTAFPTGAPRPTASNLNVVSGQTVPNMVIVPLGAGGQVSLYNNAGSTHLVVDVLGWFPAIG